MKKIFARMLALLPIAGLLFVFANCGGDDPSATIQQTQLDKLVGTWTYVDVTYNGAAHPAQDYTGFSLTISGTYNSASPDGPYNYSVTGTETPSPWPPSGTWNFGPDAETQIIRAPDGMAITYSLQSNGELELAFTCNSCDFAGARTTEVNGNWVFTLSK